MAEIKIVVDVDDDLLERVRAHAGEDDIPADLWEEAENAVLDYVRATFTPMLLVYPADD